MAIVNASDRPMDSEMVAAALSTKVAGDAFTGVAAFLRLEELRNEGLIAFFSGRDGKRWYRPQAWSEDAMQALRIDLKVPIRDLKNVYYETLPGEPRPRLSLARQIEALSPVVDRVVGAWDGKSLAILHEQLAGAYEKQMGDDDEVMGRIKNDLASVIAKWQAKWGVAV